MICIIQGIKEIVYCAGCREPYQLVLDNGVRKEHGGFFATEAAAEAAWESHLAGQKALSAKTGGSIYQTWRDVPGALKDGKL